jgi:hypothetical protein
LFSRVLPDDGKRNDSIRALAAAATITLQAMVAKLVRMFSDGFWYIYDALAAMHILIYRFIRSLCEPYCSVLRKAGRFFWKLFNAGHTNNTVFNVRIS